jgi:hypothetical protein
LKRCGPQTEAMMAMSAPDAGDGGEPLTDRVRVEDGLDLLVDQGEPLFERAELIARGVESLPRRGRERELGLSSK